MKDKKTQKKEQIIKASLKLFAQKGFYTTTIPDIAKSMKMSVGNMYNYFKSKDILAKEVIKYISKYLGEELQKINEQNIPTPNKIKQIVTIYFQTASEKPEMIDYFLRVFLSNRETFTEGCDGMICVNEFVTEIMIFFEEGVAKGDLKDQDFFSAFGLFMGYLGGMVFLNGEKILPTELENYIDDISENIYNALKV